MSFNFHILALKKKQKTTQTSCELFRHLVIQQHIVGYDEGPRSRDGIYLECLMKLFVPHWLSPYQYW